MLDLLNDLLWSKVLIVALVFVFTCIITAR